MIDARAWLLRVPGFQSYLALADGRKFGCRCVGLLVRSNIPAFLPERSANCVWVHLTDPQEEPWVIASSYIPSTRRKEIVARIGRRLARLGQNKYVLLRGDFDCSLEKIIDELA